MSNLSKKPSSLPIVIFGSVLVLLSVVSAAFFIFKIASLSSSSDCIQFCGAGQELGIITISLPILIAALSLFVKERVTLTPVFMSGIALLSSISWFLISFFSIKSSGEMSEKIISSLLFIASTFFFSVFLVRKSSNK